MTRSWRFPPPASPLPCSAQRPQHGRLVAQSLDHPGLHRHHAPPRVPELDLALRQAQGHRVLARQEPAAGKGTVGNGPITWPEGDGLQQAMGFLWIWNAGKLECVLFSCQNLSLGGIYRSRIVGGK